jgi:hypothetical protein
VVQPVWLFITFFTEVHMKRLATHAAPFMLSHRNHMELWLLIGVAAKQNAVVFGGSPCMLPCNKCIP